jgi:zinc transport system substrate-binding protein
MKGSAKEHTCRVYRGVPARRSRSGWKRRIAWIVFLWAAGLMGCRHDIPPATGKLQVVTTLFPLFDFCRQIAGDEAEITLLVPPGVEPHEFEPKPADIIRISKAGLFVYTGRFMEPWVQGMLKGITSDRLVVIDASAGIQLLTEQQEAIAPSPEGAAADPQGSGHAGREDPHIWLDPVLAREIVKTIADGFVRMDPAHKDTYLSNAAAYDQQLAALDSEIRQTIAKCRTHSIVCGGHVAFGYFARRYGLELISPYQGFSPDAEPTPRRMVQVMEALKKAGTRTIYYEELVQPRVARVLAESTGATLLLLDGAHNVSKEDFEKNVTYLQIMEGNLTRLKLGLGYQE